MSPLITLLLVTICSLLLFPVILHWVYRAPRIVEKSTPEQRGMPYTEHYLHGVNGKRLFTWHISSRHSKSTLVIVHGWGANAEMMLPLAEPFHNAGMDLLLYDARNHGRSDGDSFSSLPRFAEDLETAIDWIKQHTPGHKVIVLGHSIGAAASILTASRRHDIDLVIGLSGFAHPNLVMNRHLDRPWIPRFMRTLIMSYIQKVIGYSFEDIAPMNRIREVQCPVLLAHGTDDRVVPIGDMHLIESNTEGQPKIEMIAVDGAKHDSIEHFEQQSGKIIEFIKKSLPGA